MAISAEGRICENVLAFFSAKSSVSVSDKAKRIQRFLNLIEERESEYISKILHVLDTLRILGDASVAQSANTLWRSDRAYVRDCLRAAARPNGGRAERYHHDVELYVRIWLYVSESAGWEKLDRKAGYGAC